MTRRAVAALGAVVATLVLPAAPAYADGIRDSQWHLSFLDVVGAQRHSMGVGVTVAVVDSGVDPRHADLEGSVLPGIEVTSGTGAESDVDGRGTGLAGLIAGHGHGAARSGGPDGSDGVLGIAPRARVLPVAITSRPGQFGDPDVLADGIDAAVAAGASVICVGRGLPPSPRLEQAVANAVRAGAVVVAPLANRRGDGFLAWPASYPGVVAVAPVDRTGALVIPAAPVAAPSAAPSERPAGTVAGATIAAPGTDLVTTDAGGGYRIDAGTGSAALVAGVAALVRARFPQLSGAEVIRRLTVTATDRGPAGPDPGYGAGLVNPTAALTQAVPVLAVPEPTTRPSPTAAPRPTETAATPAPAVPPGPADTGLPAFDSRDWRRWLVAVPLLVFLAGLVWFATRGRKAVSAR